MKEVELNLEFAQRDWKEVQQDLGKIYDNGYRKVVLHIQSDNPTYESLAEEAQFHGFWVKLIVTGGKKMRSFVRHIKPEEVEVLSDKKGKMKILLLKKAYINVGDSWINTRANFGEAEKYQIEEEECLN